MLTDFFPRGHRRYSALPIFGPALDGFSNWLTLHGYHRDLIRLHLRTTRRLDQDLQRRGHRSICEIRREDLLVCCPKNSQDDVYLASTVRCWERYLDAQQTLAKPDPTRIDLLTTEYCTYLKNVLGASISTLRQHSSTAASFLTHLGYEASPSCLKNFDKTEIETFVRTRGQHVNRASLQHEIAHLRSFLRFLATRGVVKPGLDQHIDTPRLYRGEQLPRSLPWDSVQTLLGSIDRTTVMGMRDYAIFLLMATYGLRASEIVTLKLDDIQWRLGVIRISLRKTLTPLLLPLTDSVGESLVTYLRHGRPSLPYREVFLRCRAPAGLLKPTAVTEAFQALVRRSGLNIPYQGPHCLRHSYAVHLLRQGVSLKIIGDLLGHRNAESTCVYIRLAVEDLRDVALSLPTQLLFHESPEAQP
jgi:site-specific recombinase XerD